MQATAQQIINTFNAIDGDYEATCLQGVWHAFCDSGIMADAFSVNDAERINAANVDLDEVFALEDINTAVRAFDNGDDLDCLQCVNAILTVSTDVEEFFDNYSAFV